MGMFIAHPNKNKPRTKIEFYYDNFKYGFGVNMLATSVAIGWIKPR